MKNFHAFVSPLFTKSLIVTLISIAGVQLTGGMGPCAPVSGWGWIFFIFLPFGFMGLAVGLFLSIIKTGNYFLKRKKTEKFPGPEGPGNWMEAP